jgi:hypothetical protein
MWINARSKRVHEDRHILPLKVQACDIRHFLRGEIALASACAPGNVSAIARRRAGQTLA